MNYRNLSGSLVHGKNSYTRCARPIILARLFEFNFAEPPSGSTVPNLLLPHVAEAQNLAFELPKHQDSPTVILNYTPGIFRVAFGPQAISCGPKCI